MWPCVARKYSGVCQTGAVAIQCATKRIRVDAVAPGAINTPMTARWLTDSQYRASLRARTLMRRVADLSENAEVAVWL